MIKIDTADVIFHRPSRETWLVAYVRGEHLCACGWPESLAALSDCLLVEKASAEERMELLRSMASGSGGDSRNRYARAALAAQPAPSVMDFASEIAKIIRHAREGNRPGVESYALLLCDKIDAAEPRLSRYLRRVIAGDDGEHVYLAAQPPPAAPTPEPSDAVAEFARGIDAAARFVEKRLADYDAAHGSTDSDTGAREYPGTGDEYVCELAEIAEAIRGLAPPPAAPEPSANERRLRRLLCIVKHGRSAYMDDGEAQDSSAHPSIDYLRDSLDEIEAKWRLRASATLTAPEPSEAEVAAAMASLYRAMEPAAWPSEDEVTDALRAAAAARNTNPA